MEQDKALGLVGALDDRPPGPRSFRHHARARVHRRNKGVDGLVRREVGRQGPPGDPAADQVEDRVQDQAPVPLLGPAPAPAGATRRPGAAAPAAPTARRSSSNRGRSAAARDDHHLSHEQSMTSTGTWTIRAPGLLVGLASLDSPSPTRGPSPSGRTAHRPSARAGVRIVRRFRPAPNTFADAVDEGPSVVAVPAEGLHGGCAGAGPLRRGAAGRAPGGVPVRVRAPVPA